MSKHTLGPWRVERDIYVVDSDGCAIYPIAAPNAEDRRIARLIAAAPDLLEALRTMLAAHSGICEGEGDMGEDEDCARARAAIAKAEGAA